MADMMRGNSSSIVDAFSDPPYAQPLLEGNNENNNNNNNVSAATIGNNEADEAANKVREEDSSTSVPKEIKTVPAAPGAPAIAMNENINTLEFKAYFRRHLVLIAYMMGNFFWNMSGTRQVVLNTAYAEYYNTTSETSEDLGVDFINTFSAIAQIFPYFFAAVLVDRIGLRCMWIGNFGLMIAAWVWYAAGRNFKVVIFSVFIASCAGPLTSVSLVAVSNRWYPPHQRSKATAAGSIIGLLGAGIGLLAGPSFRIKDQFKQTLPIFNPNLKSCDLEGLNAANASVFQFYLDNPGQEMVCSSKTKDPKGAFVDADSFFCCYTKADVETYNLVFGIIATVFAIYTVIVVRDLPPTPAGPAAEPKPKVPIYVPLKHILTNKRIMILMLADFFVTGPPQVLFATSARILPEQVQNFSFIMAAAAVGISIPACVMVAIFLDRTHKYWQSTFSAYCLGMVCWLIACIGFETAAQGGGLAIVFAGCLAIVAFVVWSATGYELKMEWSFTPLFQMEGAIQAVDRIMVACAISVFVSSIPPERVTRQGTYWIGFGLFAIGVLIASFIPNKYQYNRQNYEAERKKLANKQDTP